MGVGVGCHGEGVLSGVRKCWCELMRKEDDFIIMDSMLVVLFPLLTPKMLLQG